MIIIIIHFVYTVLLQLSKTLYIKLNTEEKYISAQCKEEEREINILQIQAFQIQFSQFFSLPSSETANIRNCIVASIYDEVECLILL